MKRFLYLLISTLCCLCIADISESATPYILNVSSLSSSWQPKPNTYATFTISIIKPANSEGANLRVSLSDVTNYPGRCGNSSSTSEPDLQLEGSNNPHWTRIVESSGQVVLERYISPPSSSQSSSASYTVKVTCYDYAAYGRLTITLGSSSFSRDIPLDNNDNKIADGWENQHGIYTSNVQSALALVRQDTDPGTAGNPLVGDGLSVMDEYRGFFMNSIHTRTNPNKWDIFVRSNRREGYAHRLPSITINLVNSSEIKSENIENLAGLFTWYTTGTGSKAIFAIRVKEILLETDIPASIPDALGSAPLGPPEADSIAKIYTNRITTLVRNDARFGLTETVDSTIAHEIAHCINADHCSDRHATNCIVYALAHPLQSTYHYHHNGSYDVVMPADVRPPQPTSDPIDLQSVQLPPSPPSPQTLPEQHSSSTISTSSGSTNCENDETHDYCNDEGDGVCTHNGTSTTNGSCGYRYCLCELATNSGGSSDDSSSDDSSDDDSTSSSTTSRGCSYNFYGQCQDEGDCMNTGNAQTSDCGKSNCRCTPPTPTGCNTSYIWAGGTHQCNDAGSCSNTGNASQSTCGRGDCSCS